MIDPRPASFNRLHHGADAEKHPRQVDVDNALPLRERVVLQRADVDDARVVDQHVDAAELAQGGGHRRVPILGFGHVEVQVADGLEMGVDLRGHGLALVVEDVTEDHLGSLGDQRPHVRCAHPPGAAADEGDLSRQPFCHCASPVL